MLFVGYGRQFGRWYLGAEAEGETSQADWSFAKSKADARSSSLDKDDSYGLSLRGGYVVDNGSLLYLRAGRVETRFGSFYTVNDQLVAAGSRDDPTTTPIRSPTATTRAPPASASRRKRASFASGWAGA